MRQKFDTKAGMKNQIRKITQILLSISILLFTSCISTKKMIKENSVEIVKFSRTNLNGTYSNKIEPYENFGLWDVLYRSYSFRSDTIGKQNDLFVKLELIDEENLNVKLINNDLLISKIRLKGKIENGYFSIKRKYLLIPIPLFLIRKESKILLGNSDNGDLILIQGYKSEGWILIMAGGCGGISNYEFEKIKNDG